MGGSGSGNFYHYWRDSKKTTVEECLRLDANRWMREGILKPGFWLSGDWLWFRDSSLRVKAASIGYEVNTRDLLPWVRLHYTTIRTKEALNYRIRLTTTQPRFGGLRWWFVCPLIANGNPCGRRVGKLYLPPGGRYFGCRHCHELTYTSCQESHKYDTAFRHLAQDTGYDFATTKQAMQSIGKSKW
jgi:hypothetical protein